MPSWFRWPLGKKPAEQDVREKESIIATAVDYWVRELIPPIELKEEVTWSPIRKRKIRALTDGKITVFKLTLASLLEQASFYKDQDIKLTISEGQPEDLLKEAMDKAEIKLVQIKPGSARSYDNRTDWRFRNTQNELIVNFDAGLVHRPAKGQVLYTRYTEKPSKQHDPVSMNKVLDGTDTIKGIVLPSTKIAAVERVATSRHDPDKHRKGPGG